MKKYIKVGLFLICFLNTGCNQKNVKSKDITSVTMPSPSDSGNQPVSELKKEPQFDNLADFANLVPIEVINPKSNNVYEKYGIEFSGNCYACDLAAISVTKKNFDIINVCDKNDFYRDEKFNYQASPNEFIVNTEKNKFIFTKN